MYKGILINPNLQISLPPIINPIGSGSYILDQITGAIAAFGLTKMKSTATKAIRVRRDSDNAQTDIGFWGDELDIYTLNSFVGSDSAYITKWYNQVQSGLDANQTTQGDQPRIVNAGVLDDGLVFDGVNSNLMITNNTKLNIGSGNVCVCILMKTTNATAGQVFYTSRGDTTKGVETATATADATELYGFIGGTTYTFGTITSSMTINDGDIKSIIYNYNRNSLLTVYVNNVSRGTKDITVAVGSANANKNHYIGRNGGTDTKLFSGTMYQIVVFSKLLSTNELNSFFLYN